MGGDISKYLLALNAHEKIGSQTIKKALFAFGNNPEKIWKAGENDLGNLLGDKIANLIIDARKLINPDAELDKIKKLNIGYFTIFDDCYPPLLKEIYDCPALLYIKGDINALRASSIALVGSRKYSQYGQRVTRKLSSEIVANGLAIVSGMALGIDAIAHTVAVENGGITIGVLGSGIDKIYPVSNSNLAERVVVSGGAIISEFPPGTPPYKSNFPARNRIIAGLSLGTLVIEAAEKSGALITALAALEYNREVFSIPGPIDSDSSIGANKLIQNGAKLVMSAADIFSEINFEAKEIEQKVKELSSDTEEEKIILEILGRDEKSADEIIAESQISVIKINRILTMMEMKGILENVGGSRFRRK